MTVLLMHASPLRRSRTGALLDAAGRQLQRLGLQEGVRHLRLVDLPSSGLLAASHDDVAIRLAVESVLRADAIVVATPVLKSAYSGLLKVFLDLLPQNALAGKTVLPLATGGSAQHALALDYALRPVLQSLAARNILPGVYALDQSIALMPEGHAATLSEELGHRLQEAVASLVAETRLSLARFGAAAAPVHISQVRCSV